MSVTYYGCSLEILLCVVALLFKDLTSFVVASTATWTTSVQALDAVLSVVLFLIK